MRDERAHVALQSVRANHSAAYADVSGFRRGLSLGLWLYAGYEQVSSVAEEVENPQRSYPRALAWVVPLSMLNLYFANGMLRLAPSGNWENWHDRIFSQSWRSSIGGPMAWIRHYFAAAVMNLSILNSTVLTTTRMPSAMAEDGYLSGVSWRVTHPRFGTPWLAILLSGAIYCLVGMAQRCRN